MSLDWISDGYDSDDFAEEPGDEDEDDKHPNPFDTFSVNEVHPSRDLEALGSVLESPVDAAQATERLLEFLALWLPPAKYDEAEKLVEPLSEAMGTFEKYDPLVCVPRSAVKVAAVEQQEDFSPTEAQIELQRMWQTWPTEEWPTEAQLEAARVTEEQAAGFF